MHQGYPQVPAHYSGSAAELVLHPAIPRIPRFSAPGNWMSLVVVGINHRTAPVDVRERVVFEPARVPDALRELATLPPIKEAVIVSTCNRTELYCVTDTGEADLGDWLQRYHQLGTSIHALPLPPRRRARPCRTRSRSPRASTRWCSASRRSSASSRTPTATAQDAGTTGPGAEPAVPGGLLGGQARAHRDRRSAPTPCRSPPPPWQWRRTVFASFENRTALLIGAGETIELAARHLHADGLRRMIVANRSIDRARELAAEFQGFAIGARRDRRAPARGRHRGRLHRQPDAIITREMADAGAARAQAPADVHGGHRRAARHRAGGRRARGRVPVHRRRPAVRREREHREPPPGGARGRTR